MLVMIYICWFTISSPYLLVFGNDHVCSTLEQMMLQVDLVRHRAEAWASLGKFLQSFITALRILRIL